MARVRQIVKALSAWGGLLALAITALAGWFHSTPLGQTVNDLAYDRFIHLDSRVTNVPANVLCVYTDLPLENSPDDYLKLIERLKRSSAIGIGVTQLDARSWTAADKQTMVEAITGAPDSPPVVFGDLNTFDSVDKAQLLTKGLRFGDIDLIHSPDGVCRWSRGRQESGDSFVAALASILGEQDAEAAVEIPDGQFGVRFRGGVETLPHVTAQSVLNGEITDAMMRDRFVLLGHASTPWSPGVATPTTDYDRMSMLEFHGHALNTLVTGKAVRSLAASWNWPIFFASAIVYLAVGRRVRLDRVTRRLALAWAVQALAAFLLVWFAGIYLSIVSLMLAQGIAICWSLDHRMHFSERAWQILRRRGFGVSPRYKSHPHLSPGVEPSMEVAELILQLFPVTCVSILVRDGDRDHLRLKVTQGCADTKVIERRRDSRRGPFAEVIDRKCAQRIDQTRPFFDKVEDSEQYMAPVFHAGMLKGMVAVEVEADAVARIPDFVSQLTEVCDELATWFARYEQITSVDQTAMRWWNRWSTHAEAESFEKLNRHLRSIERRLHQAFSLVEHASVGKAVFDLSGKALTINAAMFRMLHRCGLGSTDVRLLSIVRTFCRRDVLECRELIRRTLVEGRRERIIASSPDEDAEPLVLVIQPLAKSSQIADDTEDMDAFEAHGVQLEIFEADLLGDVHNVRDRVTESGLSTIGEQIVGITTLIDQIATPGRMSRDIHDRLEKTFETVKQCQRMLECSDSEDFETRLPVRVDDAIRSSITESQTMIEKHLANLSTDFAEDLPEIVANPHRLREAISICLHALVQHTRENSTIDIKAKRDGDNVVVTLENKGCGVVIDRISDLRDSSRGRSSGDSARLGCLDEWLATWGGSFEAVSYLGEGAVLTMTLPKFRWGNAVTRRQDEVVTVDMPAKFSTVFQVLATAPVDQ